MQHEAVVSPAGPEGPLAFTLGRDVLQGCLRVGQGSRTACSLG